MELLKILEENEKYSKWEKERELELKERRNAIYELNKTIDLEEVKALGYDKAKEIYESIKYNLHYKEDRPKFEELLKELKEIAYPDIKKAHYYPVLNEINFLTQEQIRLFDSILYSNNKRWVIRKDNFHLFGDIKVSYEEIDKIIEFMLSKDMLTKRYVVTCPCGEESEIISEEQYLNMKKYFDIESRFKTDDVSEEEEKWYEDFNIYKDGLAEIGCECEGLEICSMEDIDDNLSFEYKLKVDANLELANK